MLVIQLAVLAQAGMTQLEFELASAQEVLAATQGQLGAVLSGGDLGALQAQYAAAASAAAEYEQDIAAHNEEVWGKFAPITQCTRCVIVQVAAHEHR